MKIRVYYEDTDCGGVVYHSNYLKYMERGRTELLRDAGIDLAQYHNTGIVFAITEANLQFRASAKYDDLLTLKTTLTEVTSYRLTFHAEIFNQQGTLCCRGDVKMVGVYTKTGTVARIPEQALIAVETLFQKENHVS